MNEPATHFANLRTVKTHIERWRNRVAERLGDPAHLRPVFDRERFIKEYAADGLISARSADAYADAFEAAIAAAHGSPARFERALRRELD
jgi:hypothetical protein